MTKPNRRKKGTFMPQHKTFPLTFLLYDIIHSDIQTVLIQQKIIDTHNQHPIVIVIWRRCIFLLKIFASTRKDFI